VVRRSSSGCAMVVQRNDAGSTDSYVTTLHRGEQRGPAAPALTVPGALLHLKVYLRRYV
jgi:hypothetical protein